MEALIGVTGIIFVSAITPGPNNFVVMREAARSGFGGALPAIAGVVIGGLALLGLVVAGVGATFAAEPRLRTAVAVGGCFYLSWLGLRLVAGSFNGKAAHKQSGAGPLPAGMIGLFAFQFLNPKSWAMVLTATSVAQAGADVVAIFAHLAALFAVIPTVCLILWSLLGSTMAKYLDRPTVQTWFDRAMGCLLAGSAVLLMIEA